MRAIVHELDEMSDSERIPKTKQLQIMNTYFLKNIIENNLPVSKHFP